MIDQRCVNSFTRSMTAHDLESGKYRAVNRLPLQQTLSGSRFAAHSFRELHLCREIPFGEWTDASTFDTRCCTEMSAADRAHRMSLEGIKSGGALTACPNFRARRPCMTSRTSISSVTRRFFELHQPSRGAPSGPTVHRDESPHDDEPCRTRPERERTNTSDPDEPQRRCGHQTSTAAHDEPQQRS